MNKREWGNLSASPGSIKTSRTQNRGIFGDFAEGQDDE